MKRKYKALSIIAVMIAAITICMTGCGHSGVGSYKPFFRFDVGIDAWSKPLSNTRYITKDAYELKPLDEEKCEKYGIDPSYIPSEEGMDTLNISGSAEFSEDQFFELADKLRSLADGRKIYVVDCRLEAHGLLNGISVSWYGDNNWAYKGMTLEQAEADEADRFGKLLGKTVTVYAVEDNKKGESGKIAVESFETERELVESADFGYLRLACNDHSWPEPEAVDEFIAFANNLDMDKVWLHFHCQAGKSRTGIFMAIYDMMKNPNVSFEDIMLRHAMTGSSYFPYADESSDIAEVYAERAENIRLVYNYIQENRGDGYSVPWSEWVIENRAAA